MKRLSNKKLRLVEFLIIGIAMGVIEDIAAVAFATEAEITLRVFWVVLLVAIPFAFISEIIVDHPRFWEKVLFFRREQPPTQDSKK